MKGFMTDGKIHTGSLSGHYFLAILFAFLLLILRAASVRDGAMEALRYCGEVLIPSILPFSVLVSLLSEIRPKERTSRAAQVVCSILKLPSICLRALLIGILSGFPLAGHVASDLYNDGRVTREDAKRLFVMVSTPSAAFVIAGIGQGMLHSLWHGVILYFSVLIASYAVGVTGGRGATLHTSVAPSKMQSRTLSEIIRTSVMTTVSVCGTVVFFSSVCSALCSNLPEGLLSAAVRMPIEVTGACVAICRLPLRYAPLRLPMLAFSLGFGGFSVGVQNADALSRCDIPISTYYKKKLLCGAIASLLLLPFALA